MSVLSDADVLGAVQNVKRESIPSQLKITDLRRKACSSLSSSTHESERVFKRRNRDGTVEARMDTRVMRALA
ncbi:MAG: hypothetical protein H0W76_20785 [Pyrinomonadaceae bacterium]|nr:hypothetical protein [Pyrinomonadaceae bacterium]